MIRALIVLAVSGLATARLNNATAQQPAAAGADGSHLAAAKPHNVTVKESAPPPVAAADASKPNEKMKNLFKAAAKGARNAAAASSLAPRDLHEKAPVVPAESMNASVVPVKADSVPTPVSVPAVPAPVSVPKAREPAASMNASSIGESTQLLKPGDRFDPPSAAAGKGVEPKGKAPAARGGDAAARALAAPPTVQPDHIYNDDFVKDHHENYSKHEWENGMTAVSLNPLSGAAGAAPALAVLAAAALLAC